MQKKDLKNRIYEFIKKHKLAVLATVDLQGKPEAAVVEFSETTKLELIFDAFLESRKCANLKNKPAIAFVIGWDEGVTIQYEGVAEELTGKSLIECKNIHHKKLPDSAKFASMPGIKYFKVTPNWIRYTDASKEPWEIFEVSFD